LALSLALLFAAAPQTFPRQQQTTPSSGEVEASRPAPAEQTARWRLYQNKTHGFSIKYPREYVILREPTSGPETHVKPEALVRVRFQDRKVLSYETAELEPPQFSLSVFEDPAARPLRRWLEDTTLLSAGDAVEQVRLEGAAEGLRVRSPRLMAPNEFYYYRAGQRIFLLVPLGQHSEAMLSTFRITSRASR
jgi:hypothetical protein